MTPSKLMKCWFLNPEQSPMRRRALSSLTIRSVSLTLTTRLANLVKTMEKLFNDTKSVRRNQKEFAMILVATTILSRKTMLPNVTEKARTDSWLLK